MMQFIGFMVIMILTAIAGSVVHDTAADPSFMAGLAQYSQWAAAHAATLGYVAVGIVCLAGIAIPPILMNRDIEDGNNRIGAIGDFAGSVSLAYLMLFVALPGIAYLLGMGWFAARKAAGF